MLLIERCIERELEGRFEVAFQSEGLSCRMAIPISSTEQK
jgi:hypothetical protein